jgi:CrcB protein
MAGGAIGALLRWLVQLIFSKWTKLPGWTAIFLVNVIGSFLIGFAVAWLTNLIAIDKAAELTHLAVDMTSQRPEAGLALFAVGFCGALTTFSTFSLDNYFLAHGKYAELAFNIIGSLLACYFAVLAGWALGQGVLPV